VARAGESALGPPADLRRTGQARIWLSPTSIRRLLAQANLEPAPRRSGPSWREFVHTQASSIVACDFFTVESIFLRRYYALFLHRPRQPTRLAGRLHRQPQRRLGDPAGAQSRSRFLRPGRAVPDS
jgi:hypothetical protein